MSLSSAAAPASPKPAGRTLSILIFGATGMVGQSVLRQALLHPRVTRVLTVGRTPTPSTHAKLTHLTPADPFDLRPHQAALTGYDSCMWCVGPTNVGKSEAEYARITEELTLTSAGVLYEANPQLSFVFVSAQGADSTGKSWTMWARVKGRTENALIEMSPRAYAFRPGFFEPLHGIESKTTGYRWGYKVLMALGLIAVWKRVAPSLATTTTELGDAMLRVAELGYSKRVLEMADIRAAGQAAAADAAAPIPVTLPSHDSL